MLLVWPDRVSRYRDISAALRLLRDIDQYTDTEREAALSGLSSLGMVESCRFLLDAYHRYQWHTTRINIIRTLARVRNQRATEHLIHVASDQSDLSLAAEAVLALGKTGDPVAAEFLISMSQDQNPALAREIIESMAEHLHLRGDRIHLDCALMRLPSLSPDGLCAAIQAISNASPQFTIELSRHVLDAHPETVPAAVASALSSAMAASSQLSEWQKFAQRQPIISSVPPANLSHIAVTARARDAANRHEAYRLDLLNNWSVECDPMDQASTVELAWHTGMTLDTQPPETVMFILRVMLARTADRLTELFKDSIGSVDPWYGAFALRKLHTLSGSDAVSGLLSTLDRKDMVTYSGLTSDPMAADRLLPVILDEGAPHDLRVMAVNSLVNQAYMGRLTADLVKRFGNLLSECHRTVQSKHLKSRLIRAMGQIRFDDDSVWKALCIEAGSDELEQRSLHVALARIRSEATSTLLLEELTALMNSGGSSSRLESLIASLATMGEVQGLDRVPGWPPPTTNRMRIALLKILSKNNVRRLEFLIAEALADNDFQVRILGIAAAKLSRRRQTLNSLYRLLTDSHPMIRASAAFAIAAIGGPKEQLRLLKHLIESNCDQLHLIRVLQSINPRPDSDYTEIIGLLEKTATDQNQPTGDPGLKAAALTLMERLEHIRRLPDSNQESPSPRSDALEKIDAALSGSYNAFDLYSLQAKAALRNAEVTYQRRDLFDESVDKSTILIQYGKAIDLLFQQTVGLRVFQHSDQSIFHKMQSRVIGMGLADSGMPTSVLVRSLQCYQQFGPDDFPTLKLTAMCRAIKTGDILKKPAQVIDGVRGWGLLILLFARRFRFNQQMELQPVLELAHSDSRAIANLARSLSILQELRNDAAHRATIVAQEPIDGLHARCQETLMEVSRLLFAK